MDLILNGIPITKTPVDPLPDEIIQTDTIPAVQALEVWSLEMIPNEKGTVLLFHGHGSNKQSLLSNGIDFYRLGYNVIMIDFRASGNSEGTTCTAGFKEAEDVLMAVEWAKTKFPNSPKTILFGSSMGAAAILRAVDELKVTASALILECPFGSLQEAVSNRFNIVGLPSFPASQCLTFWGGYLNDFNAFDFVPSNYAKNITVPTLLMYGEKDKRVNLSETKDIFANLSGPKQLKLFPSLAHVSYRNQKPVEWFKTVKWFLREHLEGWKEDKPQYIGTEIPESDLETLQDIIAKRKRN